jgi:hypothetical protein
MDVKSMLNLLSPVKKSNLNNLNKPQINRLVDHVVEAEVVAEEDIPTIIKALTHQQQLNLKLKLETLLLELLVQREVLVSIKVNNKKEETIPSNLASSFHEAVDVVVVEVVDVVVADVVEEEDITTVTDLLALNQLNQQPHCLLPTYPSNLMMQNYLNSSKNTKL